MSLGWSRRYVRVGPLPNCLRQLFTEGRFISSWVEPPESMESMKTVLSWESWSSRTCVQLTGPHQAHLPAPVSGGSVRYRCSLCSHLDSLSKYHWASIYHPYIHPLPLFFPVHYFPLNVHILLTHLIYVNLTLTEKRHNPVVLEHAKCE